MPVEVTPEDRQRGALLIAASLIAAIRLRGEPITASPKVVGVISDSLKLAAWCCNASTRIGRDLGQATSRVVYPTYARLEGLPHVCSYGEIPVVVYAPEGPGARYGNFFDASFCCPRVCNRKKLTSMLGTEPFDRPEFGYKARVPLLGGKSDRTEVDMKLGCLLVEAKLTESDFQTCGRSSLEAYRDFKVVFDVSHLPHSGNQYVSYQLIRNVLAAFALDLSSCVIVDARRQDLIQAWYRIMRCVRDSDLRTRCKVLTWQELSFAFSRSLQQFLDSKYGIFV